jgi:pyruvate formate lyase activating enzyme
MRLPRQDLSAKTIVKCQRCGQESFLVSQVLELCPDCIRSNFEAALPYIEKAHLEARNSFDLPPTPPKDAEGKQCNLCLNECLIGQGRKSYCGVRQNREGRFIGASADKGNVSWYYDPLPTNCVADWVCPGGTGAGYPDFAYREGPEYGYKNLAVFYQACSFDCLFCQNWHYRLRSSLTRLMKRPLVFVTSVVTPRLSFPTPFVPLALPWSEIRGESSASAGRPMARCIQHC